MIDAVILDLDDTLIVERRAAADAFAATAAVGAERTGRSAPALVDAVRHAAHERWYAGPWHGYAAAIGIASWEGLWCRYRGDRPELDGLRAWAPAYRVGAWHDGLVAVGAGAGDPDLALLAAELADRFGVERRARHETFADAAPALAALRATGVPMGLLTNGASCLQREKLAACGLADHFDAIVISGDRGVRKPDPDAFLHLAGRLGADPARTAMVGDSLPSDIEGALAAGLRPIWCNRDAVPTPAHLARVPQLPTLEGLVAATVGAARPRSSVDRAPLS